MSDPANSQNLVNTLLNTALRIMDRAEPPQPRAPGPSRSRSRSPPARLGDRRLYRRSERAMARVEPVLSPSRSPASSKLKLRTAAERAGGDDGSSSDGGGNHGGDRRTVQARESAMAAMAAAAAWRSGVQHCPGCEQVVYDGQDTTKSNSKRVWHTACYDTQWTAVDDCADLGLCPGCGIKLKRDDPATYKSNSKRSWHKSCYDASHGASSSATVYQAYTCGCCDKLISPEDWPKSKRSRTGKNWFHRECSTAFQ